MLSTSFSFSVEGPGYSGAIYRVLCGMASASQRASCVPPLCASSSEKVWGGAFMAM